MTTLDKNTYEAIKSHLKAKEDDVPHPYLDSNGKVTISVGVLVDNVNEFTALDMHTVDAKNNVTGEATTDQKVDEFNRLQVEKTALNGVYNKNAGYYKDKTNLRISPETSSELLDEKINIHISDVKEAVGEEAWSQLALGQKATLVDISYNTGASVASSFPNLINAANLGDAFGMVVESFYYENKSEKKYAPNDRLIELIEGLGEVAEEVAVSVLAGF